MMASTPLNKLLPEQEHCKFALIVLNCPLTTCRRNLLNLWKKASVKICADGAANRLYELIHELQAEGNPVNLIPDAVVGDFDSAKVDILDFFKEKGSKIIEAPDQDHTDFTKAVFYCLENHGVKFEEIVTLCGISTHETRMDHMFGNIETLFSAAKETEKPVWFLYGDSMSILLKPGMHTLNVTTGLEGDWCGLIPVGRTCRNITTTGLKWNLDHGLLEFGTLVSTSNTWDGSEVVTIETSDPVLWTMGIKSL